jgi:gliding motility-associated-like protein
MWSFSRKYLLIIPLLLAGGLLDAQTEDCADGIDNDGNGLVDLADPDCDCQSRDLLAVIQTDDPSCAGVSLTALFPGTLNLQWYRNDTAIIGATNEVLEFTGNPDGVEFGLRYTRNGECNATRELIFVEGGCPKEDCNNGLDDDGDGLVDLNDVLDCDCSTAPEITEGNLIPNPSFEARRDLPECEGCYFSGEMFPCVDVWRPGNSVTTIEHVLRCYAERISSPFLSYVNVGSNSSLIGGFAAYSASQVTTIETATVALLEPTIPGAEYRLEFSLDIAGGDIIDSAEFVPGEVFQNVTWYYSAVADSTPYQFLGRDSVIFGSDWENWTPLDSVAIRVDRIRQLERFRIDFTAPAEPIRYLAFGGAITQELQQARRFFDFEFYWVLDAVELRQVLAPAVFPEDLDVSVTRSAVVENAGGEDCQRGLLLTAVEDPNYQYQWYRDGVALPGATNVELTIPSAEVDGSTYRLRIQSGDACRISEPLVARPPEPFELNFVIDSLRCGGDADGRIAALVEPAVAVQRFTWRAADGTILGETPVLEGLDTSQVNLRIEDAFGCPYDYTFQLPQPPPLALTAEAESVVCSDNDGNGRVRVDFSGGMAPYTFFLNEEEVPRQRSYRRPAGTYRVRVVDAIGCAVESATVEIIEPNPFDLSLRLPTNRVSLGQTIPLNVTSNRSLEAASFSWSPEGWLDCADCPAPLAFPTASDTLRLTVTDADGCFRSAAAAVTVLPTREVFIPNAISPNGDGVNDDFRVFFGPAVQRVQALEVYDRWGGLLYTGAGNTARWPGPETDLDTLRSGVYLYRAVLRYVDGEVRVRTGTVTVIR